MNETLSIELNKLRFHAFHGHFPEERKTGNEFEVNLKVDAPVTGGTITSIRETINYVSLFEIVQQEMKEPRGLLETLAMEIAEKIHRAFPVIKNISISIFKLHPPIHQFTGNVSVTYTKEF